MFCRLTCDKSGVTWKEGYFSFVLFMSLLIVVIIVVLFPPLNFSVVLFSKKYLMAFLAGHSRGNRNIWQNKQYSLGSRKYCAKFALNVLSLSSFLAIINEIVLFHPCLEVIHSKYCSFYPGC